MMIGVAFTVCVTKCTVASIFFYFSDLMLAGTHLGGPQQINTVYSIVSWMVI